VTLSPGQHPLRNLLPEQLTLDWEDATQDDAIEVFAKTQQIRMLPYPLS